MTHKGVPSRSAAYSLTTLHSASNVARAGPLRMEASSERGISPLNIRSLFSPFNTRSDPNQQSRMIPIQASSLHALGLLRTPASGIAERRGERAAGYRKTPYVYLEVVPGEGFIITTYRSTGDLMLTSLVAHVPVQARKEPPGNAE
jgi:hypothetical protein